MFNRAQDSFPLETAKLTLREALSNLATQGLTAAEIEAEFDSAISVEFGSSPVESSDILKRQILSSYHDLGATL
jgi:hypothetical protein